MICWYINFTWYNDIIKWSGISFLSWNVSSHNCLTHEHWRLAIFEFMSTFLRPPSSKELHRVSCHFLGVNLLSKCSKRDLFYIFCIYFVNFFENEAIIVRYIILDSSNVLKIVIFVFWTFDFKKNVHLRFLWCLLLNQYIKYHRLPF